MQRKNLIDENTPACLRKYIGTTGNIFNLRILILKVQIQNADLRICFTGYSKAFNCANHQMLWKTLKRMNYHSNLITIMKSLNCNQQTVVRLENTITEICSMSKVQS